ncbi:MAG TPA: hypothetical protein VGY91_01950 [Chthoniobacterales bacterium]|nr:hypothetical protein [Chthoniobacterales bacterium]
MRDIAGAIFNLMPAAGARRRDDCVSLSHLSVALSITWRERAIEAAAAGATPAISATHVQAFESNMELWQRKAKSGLAWSMGGWFAAGDTD